MPPVSAQLVLLVLQGVQESVPLGPTPPPDRYDDAYDARLFEAWGGFELALGPRDPRLSPQPSPLRPKEWIGLEGDAADPTARAAFLQDHVIRPLETLPITADGRATAMPEQGELRGPFAYAFTRFDVETTEIRFLRAPGAEIVFVNGEGFIGDPDRRGWLGVPVALREGENEILAVGIGAGFEVELWRPMTRIVMASWAVQVTGTDPWPHPWDYLFVPLFNASTETAEGIHFHFDDARPAGTLPGLGEWHDGVFAVPLGLGHGLSYLFVPSEGVPPAPKLLAPVVAYMHGDAHAERRLLLLRCDAPRPQWPAAVPMRWPPARDAMVLVLEHSDDERFDAEALAVARFCQQRLWERSGELVPLLSAAYYDSHGDWSDPRGGFTRLDQTQAVRFGRLDAEGSVLRAGRGANGAASSYEVRASDASAMRLVYSVEPFFRTIGSEGETWSVE